MKVFDRAGLTARLKEGTEWDILIIGGGATGLGIAVDAASRGYKTLLLEQADFAKGTSSRSTKLVHGGVRYLAQGNIRLVREALRERGLFLQNAPHLTRNESFIIPCYSWFNAFLYTAGLKLYDWLSGNLSLGRSRLIGKKELLKRLPTVRKRSLKCGVLYHDGCFDDARMAVNLAQTCIEQGGTVLNYCRVTELLKGADGKISGAIAEDKETGARYTVSAKVVVNATGVFVDDILKMDRKDAVPLIRPSQGIHVVLDSSFLNSPDAIMIPKTDDGRVLFVIPWYNKVLAGTTDTPLTTHSLEPRALDSEIDFVLNTAGRYLSRQPRRADVLSVFSGLRPLAAPKEGTEKTREISRSHKVIVSDSGLVSVIGGKWTTYRKMAEDTLSVIIDKKMLSFKKCVTENLKIHGTALMHQGVDQRSDITTDPGMATIDPDSETGSDVLTDTDIARDPGPATSSKRSLSEGFFLTAAQVRWAVRNEMARTVEDMLARRSRVLFIDAKAAIALAPPVAEIMRQELNRDEQWKEQQVAAFCELAKEYCLG